MRQGYKYQFLKAPISSFGSIMENRSYEADNEGYRFSLNGQEKDDEIYGKGNTTSAEFWEYDARLGRRFNTDPVFKAYESPYACFGNNPIWIVDLNGADSTIYFSKGEDVAISEEDMCQFFEDMRTLMDRNGLGFYKIEVVNSTANVNLDPTDLKLDLYSRTSTEYGFHVEGSNSANVNFYNFSLPTIYFGAPHSRDRSVGDSRDMARTAVHEIVHTLLDMATSSFGINQVWLGATDNESGYHYNSPVNLMSDKSNSINYPVRDSDPKGKFSSSELMLNKHQYVIKAWLGLQSDLQLWSTMPELTQRVGLIITTGALSLPNGNDFVPKKP